MDTCESSPSCSFEREASSLSGRLSARDIRANSPTLALSMSDKEQTMQAEIDELRQEVLELKEQEKCARNLSQQAQAEKVSAVTCQNIAFGACNGAVTAKNEMWHKLVHETRSKQALNIQLSSCQDEVKCLRGRLDEANTRVHDVQQERDREREESLGAKANVNALTERVDSLKDQLLDTERALVKKDEELYAAASERDRTDAIQAQCKQQVSQEQALRRRAELQMQEAIKEVASASKDKQLAELQAEDARRLMDLEVKLRTQLAHEKDQVVQQLLEEQAAVAQLERRLGESEAALGAAAEELVTLRSLNFGDRDDSVQAMMTQLHDRVCQAESGRKVAEAEWYNVDRMRLEAIEARNEAENNWQQVSLILEKEQEGHKKVLQELLEERTARQLAQKTLATVASTAPPLTARTSCDVQAALLRDTQEEGRGLACLRSALADVKQSQFGVLEQVEELQNALGLLSFNSSSQAQGVETARAKAEHTCRLALMVAQRAETMLMAVGKHNDLTLAAAPTRLSSEAADEEEQWEEDSVFPDGFDGLIDDMLDPENSEAEFSDLGGGRGRGSLSGESSNESVLHERRKAHSDSSGSPAALLRPLSRAGCLSPEYRPADDAKCHSLRKGKLLGVGRDENSPLTGNGGHAASGKRRVVNVPRLVLGDASSD